MKHSSGPWSGPYLHSETGQWAILRPDDVCIAYLDRWTGDDAAEQDANIRLIAAAPDVLVALRLMLREYDALRFEQPERWPAAATAARAAIAKAEGAA